MSGWPIQVWLCRPTADDVIEVSEHGPGTVGDPARYRRYVRLDLYVCVLVACVLVAVI